MIEYLGDSVYADYSSGELRLYTDNGNGAKNEIIIDSGVLTALLRYIETSRSKTHGGKMKYLFDSHELAVVDLWIRLMADQGYRARHVCRWNRRYYAEAVL